MVAQPAVECWTTLSAKDHHAPLPATMKAPFLILGALGMVGCTSVPLPSEAAAIPLVAVSSASLEIHRPRFRMKDDRLMVEAYAFLRWKAHIPTATHVDIVSFDAARNQIAVETTNFQPRQLPHSGVRGKPHAYLLIPTQIPADTKVVEVRAHDGPHDPPRGVFQPATSSLPR